MELELYLKQNKNNYTHVIIKAPYGYKDIKQTNVIITNSVEKPIYLKNDSAVVLPLIKDVQNTLEIYFNLLKTHLQIKCSRFLMFSPNGNQLKDINEKSIYKKTISFIVFDQAIRHNNTTTTLYVCYGEIFDKSIAKNIYISNVTQKITPVVKYADIFTILIPDLGQVEKSIKPYFNEISRFLDMKVSTMTKHNGQMKIIDKSKISIYDENYILIDQLSKTK